MSRFLKLICGVFLILTLYGLAADFGVNATVIAAEEAGVGEQPNSKTIAMNPNSLAWVLLFAGVVLAFEVGAVLHSVSVWEPRDVTKMFGLTVISLSAIILVAMQAGAEVSAVITLLGTIAGHLVTADTRSRTPTDQSAPAALEIESVSPKAVGNNKSVEVKYISGRKDDGSTLKLLYQIMGTDADFDQSAPVIPAGQTIGPFETGKIVNVKTIATNSAGSTQSKAQSIKIA
ncbi:MAG: hypothetical protein AABP62_03680 [Planctomycetota bacterium]